MNNARDFKGYNGVFATRLREVMGETKTTQEILAKQTGLTRQTISQYMDGSVLPNAEKLYKICSFFDVTSDYFLGLSNSKSMDISEQHIQNTTGLSTEAINNLKELYQGRHNALFPLPIDIGIINCMLSNQGFIRNLIARLSNYFVEKQTDEEFAKRTGRTEIREETDYARYLFTKLIEHSADNCYNDFYKPSVVDRNVKRKPGRIRKTQTIDTVNEDEQ